MSLSWIRACKTDNYEGNANELDIHESTVSRAVKGKYVQTPFGTIEMRMFFSTSLSSTDYDQDISGIQAKKLLATAIHDENKQKPLSDQRNLWIYSSMNMD